MTVLKYDKDFSDMPDLGAMQKCDKCETEIIGKDMFFAYIPEEGVKCLCQVCIDVCSSCTWRGEVKLENGSCPYCGWKK